MSKKKKTNFPLFNDVGETFDETYEYLTFKPIIDFIHPEQKTSDVDRPPVVQPEEEQPQSINQEKQRVAKLIENLNSASQLLDLLQDKLDSRVKNAGGVTVKLDPKKDALTIAAVKRRFPDKADPTELTYDDYKKAVKCLCQSGLNSTSGADTLDKVDNSNAKMRSPDLQSFLDGISMADIQEAISNPYKTDFGGFSNQHGENRPEISSVGASMIEPIDLEQFQKAGVLSLFGMMKPLITKLIIKVMSNPFD